MGCAAALVALGVGYIVLLHANKEKRSLKFLGQVIAILIMLGAMGSSLYSVMKCGKGGYYGGHNAMCSMSSMSSKTRMCPVVSKITATEEAEEKQ